MNKSFKKILAILLSLTLLCVVFAFAACDTSSNSGSSGSEGGENGGSEGTLYTFEAEYTNLTDPLVKGQGISGSAEGLNLIQESSNASNGFYLASLHSTQSVITFEITAEKATTATLRLILGNEVSQYEMTSDNFIVTLNGTKITYNSFTLVENGSQTGRTFKAYKIGDVSLNEGKNVFTFVAGPNTYLNGTTAGPLFDAITLKSSVKLTMENRVENLD